MTRKDNIKHNKKRQDKNMMQDKKDNIRQTESG